MNDPYPPNDPQFGHGHRSQNCIMEQTNYSDSQIFNQLGDPSSQKLSDYDHSSEEQSPAEFDMDVGGTSRENELASSQVSNTTGPAPIGTLEVMDKFTIDELDPRQIPKLNCIKPATTPAEQNEYDRLLRLLGIGFDPDTTFGKILKTIQQKQKKSERNMQSNQERKEKLLRRDREWKRERHLREKELLATLDPTPEQKEKIRKIQERNAKKLEYCRRKYMEKKNERLRKKSVQMDESIERCIRDQQRISEYLAMTVRQYFDRISYEKRVSKRIDESIERCIAKSQYQPSLKSENDPIFESGEKETKKDEEPTFEEKCGKLSDEERRLCKRYRVRCDKEELTFEDYIFYIQIEEKKAIAANRSRVWRREMTAEKKRKECEKSRVRQLKRREKTIKGRLQEIGETSTAGQSGVHGNQLKVLQSPKTVQGLYYQDGSLFEDGQEIMLDEEIWNN